jgi:hypothetical protein
MGLDMYLTQKIYVDFFRGGSDLQGDLEIASSTCEDILKIPMNQIKAINLDFLYWRKANAIHRWFVMNVQDGVDDCREYYVAQSKIEELYKDITKAILSQDAGIFPTMDGFFFGSTEVDDYYWRELNRTAARLKLLIDEWKKPHEEQDPIIRASEFYYSSSW